MADDTRDADVQELLRIDAEWYGAYPPRDTDTIDRIVADDFFGSLYDDGSFADNRESEIRFVGEFVPDLEGLDFEVVKVQVWGDSALVLSKLMPRYKDGREPNVNMSAHYYVKRDGNWRQVFGQDTTIATP